MHTATDDQDLISGARGALSPPPIAFPMPFPPTASGPRSFSFRFRSRSLLTAPSLLLGALIACSCLATLAAQTQTPRAGATDAPATARAALEKWVETRRLISKEKRDWALGEEMLRSRIVLVEREIESLRARLADAGKSITDTDEKKEELDAEREALVADAAALRGSIATLELRTRELLPRLPDPAREHVSRLSQRIPVASTAPAATDKTTDKTTGATLGERFQNVVGLLNELDKFHREITVTPELRRLADGSTAEVTTLYIGLGQGYYVGADGKTAGIGTPTESGWVWRSEDAAASSIAAAIAILKKERVASFVQLPVDIR
jgi:hypothetical protein